MSGVKMIKLASGSMPQLGLGTWRSDTGLVKKAVEVAIGAGYRHIDAAWIYGNEREVGDGISTALEKNSLKREDIFVTSKLWNIFHDPKQVRATCEETLKSLKLEYLDLYLMHWPVAFEYQGDEAKTPKTSSGATAIDEALTSDQSSTWAAMESLVDAGLVRNIGVSNFCEARLTKLLKGAKTVPSVNQVELHPYLAQPQLLQYCAEKGIHVTAYSPLGSQGSDLLHDETIAGLAKELGVDAGQVLIAWALARGTSVIPKSVTPARVESNFESRKVTLTKEQIAKIDGLDKGKRFVDPSSAWGVDIYCAKQETVARL